MRDRLGELGLQYQYIEVPRRRADRHKVREVSNQETVPVLVISDDGKDRVLSDENAILAYLDERFGAREQDENAAPWDEAATRLLREVVEGGDRRVEALYALAERARASGETDRANCLRAAAWYVRDGQRWAAGQLEELTD
ncbi:MAG: glutathione S-transferase N-terminal domain-containing protein [Thermaerobacter sp.]|nr:glutathione S-transferase N-terminal domain-containing protein [Thermaerobacter sp.]